MAIRVRITYITIREVLVQTLVSLLRKLRLLRNTIAYDYIEQTFILLVLIAGSISALFWVHYIMETMEKWSW